MRVICLLNIYTTLYYMYTYIIYISKPYNINIYLRLINLYKNSSPFHLATPKSL